MVAKKRRARGEGSHYQRTDGTWVGVVNLPPGKDGKRRRRNVYSVNYETMVQKRRKLEIDIAEGRVIIDQDISDYAAGTVGEWLDHWLTDIHSVRIRPGTLDDYARTIRLYIKPHVGHIQLVKLTSDDLRRSHRKVQESSTRNAQIAHHVVSRALKDACAEGVLTRNVAGVVPTPRHIKQKRTGLTTDVARHIIRTAIEIDEASVTGPLLATRWVAAFYTGARQGELLGLTWDRVDLDLGVIDLSWQLQQLKQVHGCGEPMSTQDVGTSGTDCIQTDASVNETYPCGRTRPGYCPAAHWEMPPGFEYEVCHRSLVWTRPKTASGRRYVPLVEPLKSMLSIHDAQTNQPDTDPHNLVWHHRDGRPVGSREDYKLWKQLLQRAGVITEGQTLPLHAARHTAATVLLEAGVDRLIVREVLGHADEAVTIGYQHVDMSLARSALGKLSQRLAIEGTTE